MLTGNPKISSDFFNNVRMKVSIIAHLHKAPEVAKYFGVPFVPRRLRNLFITGVPRYRSKMMKARWIGDTVKSKLEAQFKICLLVNGIKFAVFNGLISNHSGYHNINQIESCRNPDTGEIEPEHLALVNNHWTRVRSLLVKKGWSKYVRGELWFNSGLTRSAFLQNHSIPQGKGRRFIQRRVKSKVNEDLKIRKEKKMTEYKRRRNKANRLKLRKKKQKAKELKNKTS